MRDERAAFPLMRRKRLSGLKVEDTHPHISQAVRRTGLIGDLFDGGELWHAWLTKAWFDVKLRYRRTVIGPFWMVISTGILIACFSLIAPVLFATDSAHFMAYLAVGIVSWNYIALTLNELSGAFIEQHDEIRSVRLPFSIYLYRVILRDLITYAHLLLIYVFIALIYQINPILFIPLFLIGVVLVTLNFIWMGLILAVLCVRYRDIQQVVGSVITIGFLITPVFWEKSLLLDSGRRSLVVHLNPFAHMIEVLRAPLLKQVPAFEHYAFLIGAALVGFPCAAYVYRRYIRRVVFWL